MKFFRSKALYARVRMTLEIINY